MNVKKFLSLSFCFSLFLSPLFAEKDFLIEGSYNLSVPLQNATDKSIFDELKPGSGANLSFAYKPFEYLTVGLGFDYASIPGKIMDGVDLFSGHLGAGGLYNVSDRVILGGSMNFGLYSASHTKQDLEIYKFSSFKFKAAADFQYRITPILSAKADIGWDFYYHKDTPVKALNIGLGLSINVSEMLKNTKKLTAEIDSLDPVFPVLYFWYNDNPFGVVNITNDDDTSLTDVTVSFYSEQYMNKPKLCASFGRIRRDETVQVELTAFFNEAVLELTEPVNANCSVIVEYKKLGSSRTAAIPVKVPVMNRNNMSWDDDRRASVFVSAKDIEAVSFAKQVSSIVRSRIDPNGNKNIQYASALFETLSLYGLNYVIDPSSSYAANVGSTSIDFLQFPYQTLNYRGGDCDDLSILYCSLLESLGINSAFITVPGHIYTAIDTGLSENEAPEYFKNTESLIFYGGKAWVPLEITMLKDGFEKAWRYGITEWKKAELTNQAMIYPMYENWKSYTPVTPPGADSEIFLPSEESILKAFERVQKIISTR